MWDIFLFSLDWPGRIFLFRIFSTSCTVLLLLPLRSAHTRGHVAGTNSMHCLHEGTCSGDKFLEVFTRRNLSQGLAKWPFLIGLFWYCRGDMLHEQFTRDDNRIFCCFVAAVWIQGTCRGDKILSPRQYFFMKIDRSHEETCRGDLSRGHVPSCVPTFRVLMWWRHKKLFFRNYGFYSIVRTTYRKIFTRKLLAL